MYHSYSSLSTTSPCIYRPEYPSYPQNGWTRQPAYGGLNIDWGRKL